MLEERRYHAGVYLRLSREDGYGMESNSIQSQRDLALSFVRERSDIRIYDFYVDDGYSGISFMRPGFIRMMRDVEAGLLNCIIVKDLSRFGRDYIEAGRLIQKTFPALHVRFIAITDRFDSLTAGYNEFSLVLPVKNFVNDSYCRDISCKVRSHQRAKREKGEFIGAFSVYGYLRDSKNRGRLVPDAYAAGVVRDIFSWRLSGMSGAAIAARLNRFGILSPMEYKKSRGENYSTGFATDQTAQWSATAVMRILRNEVYLGNMVQGKREKISYKLSACRKKPREEWICVEHTHTPLVTEEDFGQVQRMHRSGRACKGQEKAHLFSGILFCGDCGKPMVLRRSSNREGESIYFICSTKNAGRGCTRHRITREELTEKVGETIKKKLLQLPSGEEAVCERGDRREEGKAQSLLGELQRLRREAERYLKLKNGLEEDRKGGILSQEDFRAFRDIYEKRYQDMREAIERQERRLGKLQEERSGVMKDGREESDPWRQYLTREALDSLVRNIYVYEKGKIRVCFKEAEE